MEVSDIKVFCHMAGRFKATEMVGDTEVCVAGNTADGWKVWVTTPRTAVCVNPKNNAGEMLVYKTRELAVAKANRMVSVLTRNQTALPLFAIKKDMIANGE